MYKRQLVFSDDKDELRAATAELAATAKTRGLEQLTVEKVNGDGVHDRTAGDLGPCLGRLLQEAGFVATPRGFTLRKTL